MVSSILLSSVRQNAGEVASTVEPDLMKTFVLAYESVIETLRPSMKVAGLTEPQWRVLHELRARSPMIAPELAANTFVRASSLSRILRDLEARDLIARAQQLAARDSPQVYLLIGRRHVHGTGGVVQFANNIQHSTHAVDRLGPGLVDTRRQ